MLLQAAFDNDDLEPGNIYGTIAAGIPNARLLVTTSQLDTALGTFYPEAEWLNLFRNVGHRRIALGFGGPTPAVEHDFGPVQRIAVGPGFNGSAVPAPGAARLIVADLTPLHADASSAAFNEPLAGHHGDIFRDEIYALIAAFV